MTCFFVVYCIVLIDCVLLKYSDDEWKLEESGSFFSSLKDVLVFCTLYMTELDIIFSSFS